MQKTFLEKAEAISALNYRLKKANDAKNAFHESLGSGKDIEVEIPANDGFGSGLKINLGIIGKKDAPKFTAAIDASIENIENELETLLN
jgi:hypothetical protein